MTFHDIGVCIQARFGLEKDVTEFADDFSHVNRTLITITQNVRHFSTARLLDIGASVPIIYADMERVIFDSARWGRQINEAQTVEEWREANGNMIARPALIPISFFDISIGSKEKGESIARVRPTIGSSLYVGASYWFGGAARVSYVTPLTIKSGPDLEQFCRLQPLLIPKGGPPVSSAPGISAFIDPAKDSRLFQQPSKRGSLLVTTTSKIR